MIVQIMAYDPNFYKEHTFVFSDIHFPNFEQKVILDPDESWTQFAGIQGYTLTSSVQPDDKWLQFYPIGNDYSIEGKIDTDVWSEWHLVQVWGTLQGEVELAGQGWTDFFLPYPFDLTTTQTNFGTNYGRFANQTLADVDCPVLPVLIQSVENKQVAQHGTSYPVTDNHIVEVYTTHIDIMPTPLAEYQPSTY